MTVPLNVIKVNTEDMRNYFNLERVQSSIQCIKDVLYVVYSGSWMVESSRSVSLVVL